MPTITGTTRLYSLKVRNFSVTTLEQVR